MINMTIILENSTFVFSVDLNIAQLTKYLDLDTSDLGEEIRK